MYSSTKSIADEEGNTYVYTDKYNGDSIQCRKIVNAGNYLLYKLKMYNSQIILTMYNKPSKRVRRFLWVIMTIINDNGKYVITNYKEYYSDSYYISFSCYGVIPDSGHLVFNRCITYNLELNDRTLCMISNLDDMENLFPFNSIDININKYVIDSIKEMI